MKRKYGWIPDKDDSRDLKFRSVIAVDALPQRVDLSNTWNVPVEDQGPLGSCTGNAIASALAYLQDIERGTFDYPSRLFIYYNERVIEGTVSQDSGAEIRDGIKTVSSEGFCPETDWPYDVSKFAVKPPAKAYADASKDLVKTYQSVAITQTAIMSALAQGYPVIVGFDVYDSFEASVTGDIPMPNVYSENLLGGHCVIVVGYDQTTKRFKFQNSWGFDWGTNGYGTLPFAYLGAGGFGGDYWIVTSDSTATPVPPTPTPTPDPTPEPTPVPSPSILQQIWTFVTEVWRLVFG